MKKFLSIYLLCLFVFTNINLVQAIDIRTANESYSEDNKLITKVVYSKTELEKISSGLKYIKTIDSLILKLEKKQDKIWLINLKNKILEKTQNIKSKNITILLNYILAKIELSLYNLSQIVPVSNISEDDKKIIEKEILLLQNQIYNNLETTFDSTLLKLKKELSYEEKGNFSTEINANYALVWEVKAKLEANDYTVLNSDFDSKASTKLKWFFEAKKVWDEKTAKLDFSAFMDVIQKESDIYLLLKDLNIVDETWITEMKTYIESLKNIAKQNKYISIKDIQWAEAIDLIKSIKIDTIKADVKEISKKPLFEAYSKIDNKYYLQPTKYACDLGKMLDNGFDKTKTCSNSEYNYILKEFNSKISSYITLWDIKNIVLEDKKNPENNLKISFNTSKILTADLNVKDYSDSVSFNYIANKSLIWKVDADWVNISLKSLIWKVDADWVNISFDFIFDYNNSIKTANLDIKSDELNSNIKLENWNISGTTSIDNMIKISHNGKYAENYLELNNKLESNQWYDWNLNLSYDIRNNKDDINIYADWFIWKQKVFDMTIKNTATRTYKNWIKIEAPKDTIKIEDIKF